MAWHLCFIGKTGENISFENIKIITIYADNIYLNNYTGYTGYTGWVHGHPPLQGGLFWTFICPHKCPFCPLRVGVLKHEMQNTQKWACDHNAHKTCFWSEKPVTDFFWGSVGASKLVG